MDGMGPVPHVFARLHRLGVVAAVSAFAVTAAIALATNAGAAKVTVIGAAAPVKPSCPNECQVVARVTGFQTAIGARKKPFVAPFRGRIVAWSIKLGRPEQKDYNCLTNGCGSFPSFGEPRARLSILKPLRKEIRAGRPKYRLLRQSPVEDLKPFLGTTTTFTLGQPLKVGKGQIVALSAPTWAPAFAINQGRSRWRGSRKRRRCANTNNSKVNAEQARAGSAHQGVGTDRTYACAYGGARLLYSATMVKRPRS
jgi:hypothetical protein